jgi:hypothetical protein
MICFTESVEVRSAGWAVTIAGSNAKDKRVSPRRNGDGMNGGEVENTKTNE